MFLQEKQKNIHNTKWIQRTYLKDIGKELNIQKMQKVFFML